MSPTAPMIVDRDMIQSLKRAREPYEAKDGLLSIGETTIIEKGFSIEIISSYQQPSQFLCST